MVKVSLRSLFVATAVSILPAIFSLSAHATPECFYFDEDPRECEDNGCRYDEEEQLCLEDILPPADPNTRPCRAYNESPELCDNQRQCYFDDTQNACLDDFGDDDGQGGIRACSSYNGSEALCNNQAHCFFDDQTDQCLGLGSRP